jgi:hypothetical protein
MFWVFVEAFVDAPHMPYANALSFAEHRGGGNLG